MTVKKAWMACCVAMIAALSAAPVAAVEVYQWTDENGVVHFSQWAPDEQVADVATIDVDDAGDNGLGISEEDDPDGYQAHREEMAALWSQIEDRRAAAQSRPDPLPATEVIFVGSEPGYEVFDWDDGFRRGPPWLPDFRPRPGRPGHDFDDPPGRNDRPGRGKRPASVPYKSP